MLAARCTLLEARGAFAEALALLESGPRNPELLLARGRVLDRLGRYAEAFAAFDAGKALHRASGGRTYPADEVAAMLARFGGFYTARRVATLPRAPRRADLPLPIFLFGFPRSGTTMTEQVLSAHSAIAAGDELPLLGETAEAVPRLLASPLSYPEALAELWMGEQRDGLAVLRDHYLRGAERLGALDRGIPFFTDKMPLNETHMGLAALLFPDAPMIHVLRHPLDVVLSVFGTLLTHGFNCAAELGTIALHYARMAEFVAHVRREMALDVLMIRYEDMVADLETSAPHHARCDRAAVRARLPRLPHQPALRAHGQPVPGRRAALRAQPLSLAQLPRPARPGHSPARPDDRAARLRACLRTVLVTI